MTSLLDDASPRYAAPALEKGLDILELLARERRPLTMTEIGALIGRSKSQIFRNLRTLEERGYIARGAGDERFQLTNRLFEMGMRSGPIASLVGAAYPEMTELARRFDQSVHLAVVSRDQMVVVVRVESPGDPAFSVAVGHRRTLHQATSGLVLLAFQHAQTLERLLGMLRARDPMDETALLARLARIRGQGHEVAESVRILGITDIGVPLLDANGEAQAVLGMPFTFRRLREDDLAGALAAMLAAAERIDRALGARVWHE